MQNKCKTEYNSECKPNAERIASGTSVRTETDLNAGVVAAAVVDLIRNESPELHQINTRTTTNYTHIELEIHLNHI